MKRSLIKLANAAPSSDKPQHDRPFAPPPEDHRMVQVPLATGQDTVHDGAMPQNNDSVPTSAIPAPPTAGTPAGRGLVPVLAFSGIAVAVMQTLLVPVIADLPRLLDTTTSNAAWVITATLLSSAVASPIIGRLGDLYGKRRFLLVSLGLMVLGSLVSGFTSDLMPMVLGRAVQGFALGAVPLGISIIRDELPPERHGSAMALMSSSLGIGGALAIPLAALVAQNLDWHWLFFGAAAIGAVAIAAIFAIIPESAQRTRTRGRFDVIGALGLTLGLVALLLPISKGADWGWGSATTLGLFAAAVVIFLLWGLFELRTKDPLLDLRTASRRQVLLTNLAAITVGFAFFAVTLVMPQLLQLPECTGYGLGMSMVVTGVCAASMGLAMMTVSPLAARLSAARGPKVSLMTGLVLLAVAYLAGTALLGAVWQIVLGAVLAGSGVGVAYSAMPPLILGAVDPSESGVANGLNSLMRSIGTSMSSAVVGVVLASTTQRMGSAEVPTLDGFRTSFLIAAGAALLGLVIAAFLPGRTQRDAG
ncbi:MFS transporter [Streptomyces canus]|uniref:MFS transporter n=1 Tax=Streptomyces canus TaxID=58343 RepID=UPI0036A9A3EF